MGFTFFRSKKVGLFRINASTSGLGISFGVKGARVNFSPRGTFVNVGAQGVYYRKKISSKSRGKFQTNEKYEIIPKSDGKTIGTLDLDRLSKTSPHEFNCEIQKKSEILSLAVWLGIIPSIILMFAISNSKETITVSQPVFHNLQLVHVEGSTVNIRDAANNNARIIGTAHAGDVFQCNQTNNGWHAINKLNNDSIFFIHSSLSSITDSTYTGVELRSVERKKDNSRLSLFLLPFIIGWNIFLLYTDRNRKRVELYYAFDEESEKNYQILIDSFKALKSSSKTWHYTFTSNIKNKKYHAGANKAVKREEIGGIFLESKPATFFATNILIPEIKLSNLSLFFLPERILLKRGKKFASVFYRDVTISSDTTRFVEDEGVPKDARVVEYTYKYVNKNGGPDRRFKGNSKIPVCLYSQYNLKSSAGLSEVIVTSRLGGMDKVVGAILKLKDNEN